MTSEELEDRTAMFAARIIKVCEALPQNRIGAAHFLDQLFRSGTSVAANYSEAAFSSVIRIYGNMSLDNSDVVDCAFVQLSNCANEEMANCSERSMCNSSISQFHNFTIAQFLADFVSVAKQEFSRFKSTYLVPEFFNVDAVSVMRALSDRGLGRLAQPPGTFRNWIHFFRHFAR